MRDVVRMLCAGIVHGDLSEFNVLLSHEGPVIIDFPQAVQATANSAFSIFERDIDQLKAYFGRFSPELLSTQYAKEIWQMYKKGELRPDSPLTGRFVTHYSVANMDSVFESIQGAFEDEQEKLGIRKDGKSYR
jgi:RIO kinase 1